MLIDGKRRGDFSILCPDSEATRDSDNRRILWTAQDIIENRPALSRWHPDYNAAFARFLADKWYASGLTRLLAGMMLCQGCDLKVGVKVRCKVDVRRTY
jgi:hypothetical protein